MKAQKESFYNLIDLLVNIRDDEELQNGEEQFRYLLSHYFFHEIAEENKSLEKLFSSVEIPSEITGADMLTIDPMAVEQSLEGESMNDSLVGRIMLSPAYLKVRYPNHTPSFQQLPEDEKFELMDEMRQKKELIIEAFNKVSADREADTKRTMLTLMALILKNIHQKTGHPFAPLKKPIKELILDHFPECDKPFDASDKQMGCLKDSSSIKDILKKIFIIKQFNEITSLYEVFERELQRYVKRIKALRDGE